MNDGIKFDVSFDAKNSQAMLLGMASTLEKINETFEKMSKAQELVKQRSEEMNKANNKGFAKVRKAVDNVNKRMARFALVAQMGSAMVKGFVSGFQSFAKIASNIQKNQHAFNRYGEAGKQAYEEISKYAQESSLDIAKMRDATATLLDSFDPASATNMSKALADLASGGGDIEHLAKMTAQFASQIGVGANEVNEFAKASGLAFDDVLNKMAEMSGKGVEEIERLMRRGRVQIEDIVAASHELKAGELAFGELAKAAEDPEKAFNILNNQMMLFKEGLAKTLITPETLDSFNSLAKSLEKILPVAIKVIDKVFKWFIANEAVIIGVFAGIATIIGFMLFPFWKIIAISAGVAAAIAGIIYIAKKFGPAIMEGIGKAIDFVMNLFNLWWEHVTTFPEKMASLGLDIVKGLINGLKKGPAMIKGAVKDLANGVLGPFRKVLGIRSPSIVMKKELKHVVDGGIGGLKENTPRFEKEMIKFSEIIPSIMGGSSSNQTNNVTLNLNGSGGAQARDVREFAIPALLDAFGKLALQ